LAADPFGCGCCICRESAWTSSQPFGKTDDSQNSHVNNAAHLQRRDLSQGAGEMAQTLMSDLISQKDPQMDEANFNAGRVTLFGWTRLSRLNSALPMMIPKGRKMSMMSPSVQSNDTWR